MIFGQNRDELRQMYADAWRKRSENLPQTALETQIADVIQEHPEYHDVVSGDHLHTDFTPDGGKTNPFLHMGLHLGIREQIATNRPAGIKAVLDGLLHSGIERHDAEHRMIEVLAETLWEAQGRGGAPDELRYLQSLQKLIR